MDKQQKARDVRNDHMYHMYSILAVWSHVPSIQLQHKGHSSSLGDLSAELFLPSVQDMTQLKCSLTVLVGLLTQYIPALWFLSSIVPKHISHKYSLVMCQQSSVSVVDVLKKNETDGKDMLDITETLHGYTIPWRGLPC